MLVSLENTGIDEFKKHRDGLAKKRRAGVGVDEFEVLGLLEDEELANRMMAMATTICQAIKGIQIECKEDTLDDDAVEQVHETASMLKDLVREANYRFIFDGRSCSAEMEARKSTSAVGVMAKPEKQND